MGGAQTHFRPKKNADTRALIMGVQNYFNEITPDTPPADRLARSKALVNGVSRQLASGVRYDDDTVTKMVKALLRITLDSTHTTPELRDWLLSPEVREVVWALATGPGTASVILRGMTAAVRDREVGCVGMATWSAVLANRWFVRPDGTVAQTAPGFVAAMYTFRMLCAESQRGVCGHRRKDISTMDTELLPLVSAALRSETVESINQGDRGGHTPLHHAASLSYLPQVTEAVLAHREVDVNARTGWGYTPLTQLSAKLPTLEDTCLPPARVLLGDPRTDVTILDNGGKSVLYHCLDHLGDSEESSVRVALEVIRMVCEHQSATPAMLTTGLEFLLLWEVPSSQRDLFNDVTVSLAANPKFPINSPLRDGKTVCHSAVLRGNWGVVQKIIEIPGFDHGVEDSLGNTVLFHACAKLPAESAMAIIDHPTMTWEFGHKNKADQTVLDYYERLDTKADPAVLGVLEKRVGRVSTLNQGRQAAIAPIPEVVVEFPARPIQWTPHVPDQGGVAGVAVLPATTDFVTSKRHLVATDKVYPMDMTAKGRCCIISVPRFEVPWLIELRGYGNDSQRLGALWSSMGFDVTLPSCQGNRCLTAQEIETSVEEFSQSLSGADQCVVLAVLSHGGEGFIYGSDGNKVYIERLLRHLDNERCSLMAGKPKVVVVQACAGSANDVGVTAGHRMSPAVMAADPRLDLPTKSDFIVCSPSLAGRASYVYDTPGRGSVFLETLVDTFSQHARDDDINTLMTWVNQKVAKTRTLVTGPGGSSSTCKQMSHADSCLTKLLYFFPGTGENRAAAQRALTFMQLGNFKFIVSIAASVVLGIVLEMIMNIFYSQ